jgi:glutamine synthetase
MALLNKNIEVTDPTQVITELGLEDTTFQKVKNLSSNGNDFNRYHIEAVNAFETDLVLQDALGKPLTEAFLNARRTEWEVFRTQVTDWELNRYLTTA